MYGSITMKPYIHIHIHIHVHIHIHIHICIFSGTNLEAYILDKETCYDIYLFIYLFIGGIGV
jgi:hypothetical protein